MASRSPTATPPNGSERQGPPQTVRTITRPPRTRADHGVFGDISVEEIEDPLMREVRYLDKLVDELAKGRKMEKILRD